jgi:hypothetical protein
MRLLSKNGAKLQESGVSFQAQTMCSEVVEDTIILQIMKQLREQCQYSNGHFLCLSMSLAHQNKTLSFQTGSFSIEILSFII